MSKTTIHKLIRKQKITNMVSELVFEKKHLQLKPTSYVRIENKPYMIASGMQEAWARVLFLTKSEPDWSVNIKPNQSIRIEYNNNIIFDDIIDVNAKQAVFICNSIGIAPFLSYFSSFPMNKIKQMFYVSNSPISKDWLETNQNTLIVDTLDKNLSQIKTLQKYKYYVCGTEYFINMVSSYLQFHKMPAGRINCSISF